MKPKLISMAIIMLFAVFAICNVYMFNKHNALSDLLLDNVEALADNEVDIPGTACWASMEEECCVCKRYDGVLLHHKYAEPNSTSYCEHRIGCAHYKSGN